MMILVQSSTRRRNTTLFFLLVLSNIFIEGVATSDRPVEKNTGVENSNTIISYPLIHRDQVIARRRRELRLQKKLMRSLQEEKEEHGDDEHIIDDEPESDNSSVDDKEKKTDSADEEEEIDEDTDQLITKGKDNDSEEEGDEEIYPEVMGQLFQGLGTHFVDLWVGTPTPQRQTLIVDTGSGITAFPCEPCDDCGESYHTDGDFRNEDSTTYILEDCDHCTLGTCKHLDDFDYCGVAMAYAEGSGWHAYESRDYVYIGGSHSEPELLDNEENDEIVNEDARKLNQGRKGQRNLLRGRELFNQRGGDIARRMDAKKAMSQQNGIHESSQFFRNIYQQEAKELEAAFKKEASDLEAQYEKNHASHYGPARDFSFEMKFGCQYKITGLFKTQLADGIMGMEDSPTSFWRQMHAAGMINSKSFSLCFMHAKSVAKEGTQAGSLTLGGADKTIHLSPMIFAEQFDINGWFSVHVQNMFLKHPKKEDPKKEEDEVIGNGKNETQSLRSMDGHRVEKLQVNIKQLNLGGIIVDSGTTESYFPSVSKLPFVKAFENLMGFEFNAKLSKDDVHGVEDYPSLLIQLKGAINVSDDDLMDDNGKPRSGLADSLDLDNPNDVLLEIPPDQYMLWSARLKAYTNRFHMNDASHFGVLGANSMYRHDILFDTDKKRIGIARSDCVLPY